MSGKVYGFPRQSRAKADGFNRLYHGIVDTAAWLHIARSGAIGLLTYIWRRYNGRNNGRITFSQREAERIFRCSPKRAIRWFSELQEAGFIVAVRRGAFSQKTGVFAARATTWRLTMEPYDGNAPTRDYLHFKPDGAPNV
jgi:hypothetical protein